jgi:hypothetical protein
MAKTCSKCGKEKGIEEYHRNAQSPKGRRPNCKSCAAEAAKVRYKKTKGYIFIQQKGYDLKRKYGITLEDYSNMLKDQDYKCLICGLSEVDLEGRALHVDHCHTTSVVRGLLCYRCNLGLGNFMDNTQNLENAIKYLGGYSHR